jgi:hypothetical protein
MVIADDSGGAFISGAPVERAPLGTGRLTGLALAVRERWQKEVTGHARKLGGSHETALRAGNRRALGRFVRH